MKLVKQLSWDPEQVINAARLIYQCGADPEEELPEFSEGWYKGFCSIVGKIGN
jgi:hypothetical protein